MRNASLETIINQTRKPVWLQIAESLGLEIADKSTVKTIVSKVQEFMGSVGGKIPANVPEELASVLERMGYVPEHRAIIRPMHICGNEQSREIVEPCGEERAEFYATYLSLPDGTEEWVSDHDTKQEALVQLKRLHFSGQLDEMIGAFALMDKLDAQADKLNVFSIIYHKVAAADHFFFVGLYKRALSLYLDTLALCKADRRTNLELLAKLLFRIGCCYQKTGELSLASMYMSDAIDTGAGITNSAKEIDRWQHKLEHVYRCDVKRLIVECVDSQTVSGLPEIIDRLRWDDHARARDCFKELLSDGTLGKKATPSRTVYYLTKPLADIRRTLCA